MPYYHTNMTHLSSLDEGEFVRMMLVSFTQTIPHSPPPIVDQTGQPWKVPTSGGTCLI